MLTLLASVRMYQGRTTCYDCKLRPVPKTFPVCTIRATPSTPIHCIVWAKSYLFVCVIGCLLRKFVAWADPLSLPSCSQLFGEDDETTDQDELDKAAEDGENGAPPFAPSSPLLGPYHSPSVPAGEIENLKKEAAAFRAVRKAMSTEGGARRVFEKVCIRLWKLALSSKLTRRSTTDQGF